MDIEHLRRAIVLLFATTGIAIPGFACAADAGTPDKASLQKVFPAYLQVNGVRRG
jgi:hypothetical protein